jgi:hypothetical protein
LDTMRLRRAQRHLDRQHRAGSPECFSADGTHTTRRCGWQRSAAAQQTTIWVAELHRRLAEHRATLHGALVNRLLGHGNQIACERLDYVSWQKNFPRSVRDRAPVLLVEMMRRKAEKRRRTTALRVRPTNHGSVANLSMRDEKEKAARATGPPLRMRCQRRSGPVFGLPRTARPNTSRWGRSAGLAVSA